MRFKLNHFLQPESLSGIVLFLAAIIAMCWANSPFADFHHVFITYSLFWVNEGLMAFFFLVVGLELKREFLEGQFSPVSKVLLPGCAAVGGMLVPAFIYLIINHAAPTSLKGWATPVATDIAFALGVLSLFGKRVPAALKLFLLALAIFDDIGAIIIMAIFYSHAFSLGWLFLSAILLAVLYCFNRSSVKSLFIYLLGGAALWICLYRAGVHPTIAGVLLALMVPANKNKKRSLLHRLENRLHPWVTYLIMPLFALVNAGFSFSGLSYSILTDAVVLGIMLGLFLGKQIGVFGFSWLLIYFNYAKLPDKASWLTLYGIALLCGIGFTMSLFLGTLSFQNDGPIYLSKVRLGVIIGSFLSAFVGAIVLSAALIGKDNNTKEPYP